MDKKALTVHRVIAGLCWLCLVWQLVFYLVHWGSLPEEPGIHFAPDGTFDVCASKVYGFYPHLISLIVLAVHLVVSLVISREKLKLGLKVSEKGKRLFLGSLLMTVDLVVLSVMLCECCWVFAVSTQNENIMGKVPGMILTAGLIIAFAGIVFQCIVCAVFKEKHEAEEELSPAEKRKRRLRFLLTGRTEKADSAMFHRLSRICSWISVAMLTGIILFCLERLPLGDVADEHHGLAWFENVGEYLPKWLVFLPYIAAVPLMAVLEAVDIFTGKSKNQPLMQLCDSLKLILAVFSGWWEMLIISEIAVGMASVSIFAALCLISVIRYFIARRSSSDSGHQRNG